MVIGTFEQNGIPVFIPESQVNTYGRINICQHLSGMGTQFNFFHMPLLIQVTKNKTPTLVCRGFERYIQISKRLCHYYPRTRL